MALTERPLLDFGLSLVLFLALTAPIGLLLLRFARVTATEPHLGVALALGYTVGLPLLTLERLVPIPIVAPLAVSSLVVLWRRPPPFSLRGLLAAIPLPLALGGLAAWANARDMLAAPNGGLAFRIGFDVSDRAIYALIAEELRRAIPPFFQNPLFAGEHPAYSFFPSLLGLALESHGRASLLTVFFVHLPVLGFVMLGLALHGLLAAVGDASRGARVLTALLVVLGGDLSWFLDTRNLTALERTSRFLVFHSFSAEALFYNPWMFGLPLALAGLHLALLWLQRGEGRLLVLAGLVLGGLWETKVFACVPLLLGGFASALLLRHRRLLALALATTAGALPWVVLGAFSGKAGSGVPIAPYLFLPVRFALDTIIGLGPLATRLASAEGLASAIAMAALVPLFLAGNLGIRLVGLGRLRRLARDDTDGFHPFVAASFGCAILLGLLVVGRPVATDGAQFLGLPLLLGWLYAGPTLAEMVGRRGAARLVGCLLIAAAIVNPVRYLALKRYPRPWTSAGSMDRLFVAIPPPVLAACAWIRSETNVSDSLLLPLRGDPGDVGGLKPLYVAVLAERRLVAYAADFLVDTEVGRARRQAAETVFATESAAEAERALLALGARWVWEERAMPLRFSSPHLLPRFESSSVRVYEFDGAT